MKLNSMATTIEAALTKAGLNSRLGAMGAATGVIRRALAAAGLVQRDGGDVPNRRTAPWRSPSVYPDDITDATPSQTPRASLAGQFLSRSISLGAHSMDYRLFVPSGAIAEQIGRAHV